MGSILFLVAGYVLPKNIGKRTLLVEKKLMEVL